VSPVRYELGFYIPEDDILHTHSRDNHQFYTVNTCFPNNSFAFWFGLGTQRLQIESYVFQLTVERHTRLSRLSSHVPIRQHANNCITRHAD
jgi:hypothetical protein